MVNAELARGVVSSIALAGALATGCGPAPDENKTEIEGVRKDLILCDETMFDPSLDPPAVPDAQTFWPDGLIYYRWGTPQTYCAPAAMTDWETVTGGVIHFEPAPDRVPTPGTPVLTIYEDGGTWTSAPCPGLDGNCETHFGCSNAYHELGHAIGLAHEHERFDRSHYLRFCADGTFQCDPVSARQTISSEWGPFDYRSTLLYIPTHPMLTRSDGSSIVPQVACWQDAWSTGRTPVGPYTPTTPAGTRTEQPYGFPSLWDASAVIEAYTTSPQYPSPGPGWRKYVRTVEEGQGNALYVP